MLGQRDAATPGPANCWTALTPAVTTGASIPHASSNSTVALNRSSGAIVMLRLPYLVEILVRSIDMRADRARVRRLPWWVWNVIFFGMILLTVAPPRQMREFEDPITRLDLRRTDTPGATWIRHKMEITALRVRLNGLGARTHANWVLFRLPFDATQRERVRNIDFEIASKAPSNVAALMIGSICADFPAYGDGIHDWSSYTVNGVAWTTPFSWHGSAPTDDPTILGLNVPTRVANWVACGRDDALRDPQSWSLDVTWEER